MTAKENNPGPPNVDEPVPTLDDVVLKALELLDGSELPRFNFDEARKPLVVASGNALPTGRILFHKNAETIYADEGQYESVLANTGGIDLCVVISASGGKHAPEIIKHVQEKGIKVCLLTCKGDSEAARKADEFIVTPSREEPITYNTSTYLGMILARTGEDPADIRKHLEDTVDALIPSNLHDAYEAFYLIVPPEFDGVREMFLTKFDELFGGRVNGRCFTYEQTKHAKTVVPWDRELFVTFDSDENRNEFFGGDERLHIPLPAGADFGCMIATAYYFIGHIQRQFPAYFAKYEKAYRDLQPTYFPLP